MHFALAVFAATFLWGFAALAHLEWLVWERRQALAYLEEVIAASKPRPALARALARQEVRQQALEPCACVTGGWCYDQVQRGSHRPWWKP